MHLMTLMGWGLFGFPSMVMMLLYWSRKGPWPSSRWVAKSVQYAVTGLLVVLTFPFAPGKYDGWSEAEVSAWVDAADTGYAFLHGFVWIFWPMLLTLFLTLMIPGSAFHRMLTNPSLKTVERKEYVEEHNRRIEARIAADQESGDQASALQPSAEQSPVPEGPASGTSGEEPGRNQALTTPGYATKSLILLAIILVGSLVGAELTVDPSDLFEPMGLF